MLAKEIKPGTIVKFNEAPHMIEGLSVQSPSARGGATLYKFRAGIWSPSRRPTSRSKGPKACRMPTSSAAK